MSPEKMPPSLRPSDIALTHSAPSITASRRDTWMIKGKLFTIMLEQEFDNEADAIKRLDELAAAANDIALGAESFRDMHLLPFILDDPDRPRAILGFGRDITTPDIRVRLYEPFTGTQLTRGN